jgi:hypothetical protein
MLLFLRDRRYAHVALVDLGKAEEGNGLAIWCPEERKDVLTTELKAIACDWIKAAKWPGT